MERRILDQEYLNLTLSFLFRAKQYFLFIRLFLYDVATGTVYTLKFVGVKRGDARGWTVDKKCLRDRTKE